MQKFTNFRAACIAGLPRRSAEPEGGKRKILRMPLIVARALIRIYLELSRELMFNPAARAHVGRFI